MGIDLKELNDKYEKVIIEELLKNEHVIRLLEAISDRAGLDLEALAVGYIIGRVLSIMDYFIPIFKNEQLTIAVDYDLAIRDVDKMIKIVRKYPDLVNNFIGNTEYIW